MRPKRARTVGWIVAALCLAAIAAPAAWALSARSSTHHARSAHMARRTPTHRLLRRIPYAPTGHLHCGGAMGL